MIHLLHKPFEVVWREELVPPKWSEGLIVNLVIMTILMKVQNPRRNSYAAARCVYTAHARTSAE